MLFRSLTRDALELHRNKVLALPPSLKRLLEQYKPVIDAKNDFLRTLSANERKNTRYPHRKLEGLLRQAGVI